MVPGSTRNWIAVHAVQQFSLNKKITTSQVRNPANRQRKGKKGTTMNSLTQFKKTRILIALALVVLGLGLIVIVSIPSGRAQDFDPRCSDRTAKGEFNCTINKPIVSRSEYVYQNVVFAPGDTVYINGDGCVQTGGSGPTWKRYVNTGGDNSDHLYHGMVRIPTAKLAGTDVGNSLTRIKKVVGRLLTVTGEGVPASALVLHLGYEDDNYNDNGYDRHDPGSEDQCKGDQRNDGGPAHVTITICRGVACAPTTSRFDFDVLSSRVDPNGFLLNPHWSYQDRPGNHGKIPATSLCHEFSKHDVGRPYLSPNFPDCTDQSGLDSVDTPASVSVNLDVCRAGKVLSLDDLVSVVTGGVVGGTNSFIGHVNYFPITVQGNAGRITHEKWKDDDYDFSLVSDGDSEGSLYTNDRPDAHRKFLHVEFDSDETIDHFTNDEWASLRGNIDANANDSAAQLFVGHTIMTGMFGLDGEHGLKSELHPLYAMATRRDIESDPRDEAWLIFVRNLGDEGYCSSQIWNGGFEDYTFQLPWRHGITSVEVNWDKTKFEGTDGTSGPMVRVVSPYRRAVPPSAISTAETARRSTTARGPTAGSSDLTSSAGALAPVLPGDAGVYVTFHLGHATTIPGGGTTWGPPASIPFLDGVLHLKWTGPALDSGHTTAGSPQPPRGLEATAALATERAVPSADEDNVAEHKLEAAVARLPQQQRTRVQKARAILSTPVAVHPLARGSFQILTAPPVTGAKAISAGQHAPIAGSAGSATRKLARDAAQMRALCEATNNAPAGLPAEVCEPNVRDHRTPPVRDHR